MMMKVFAAMLVLLSGWYSLGGTAPVLHLTLDEGSGAVAKDHSGRGHHAELVNTTWEEFGIQGRAVRLNGKDSYIALPLHSDLDMRENFTFSIWFKAEDYKKGMTLFTRGNYNSGWSMYVFRSFAAFSSQKMKGSAILYNSFRKGTDQLSPFVHLVVTGSPAPGEPGKTILRFHVNGELKSCRGVSDFKLNGELPVNKVPITLGNFASAESQAFDGIIDEIKIFNRTLSQEEIQKEYKATSAVKSSGAVKNVELKKITFAPLKKKRIALYTPPPEKWAASVRPIAWFEEQAERNNCTVTQLDDRMVTDEKILNTKNFDTLILPSAVMPFECEDSIFKFLAGGGNLVTVSIMPGVFKRYADGSYGKFQDQLIKQHSRGWYSPFLVRVNPGANARRKAVNALALHAALPGVTGDLLPATFGPFPNLRYSPLDAWNKLSDLDGSYGDGNNYAQAADLKVDIYREHNGIGSDFSVYRYYNNLIFSSTFVQFGNVGVHLLQSPQGPAVFQAALRLLESPLPGEQNREYYENAVRLHKEWSDFGFAYTDALAALRDGAIFAQLTGKNYKVFVDAVAEIERCYHDLSIKRKEQTALLFEGKNTQKIRETVDALRSTVATAAKRFNTLALQARTSVKDAVQPAGIKVRHKYGTIPSIASFSVPMTLSRLRGRHFDTIRRIGSNVFSGQPFPSWYVEDPLVRKNMHGLSYDFKFVFFAGARQVTGGGAFNPANGRITQGPVKTYPAQRLSEHLTNLFNEWKWIGNDRLFRIGTADETGLGFQFWGTEAEKVFQNYLSALYGNDIAMLNTRCGTAFGNFAEIKLPVRQPATAQQHAVWEHWRTFREKKLEGIYSTFYDTVKKIKPSLDVFHLPSTGAHQSPIYGVNFYNASKYMDVNGIDGTCCAIDYEWFYTDLTAGRTLTSEWGGLYQDSTLQYVNGKLWTELSGGALGVEQHIWSFGNDSCNFADTLDLPTRYGSLLHMLLRDMRKVDHVILDGRRAEPEIGILFSQTSRIHDQAWGWGGEATFSPHMHTVSVYYKLFLDYGRSARVIAEETLLDGQTPKVAILFVPQARFLSEALQRKLLDYVRSGGRLVIEGRSGEFDNFGAPSDLLFREANIVPAYVRENKVLVDKAEIGIPNADKIFSPSGKGTVLAAYGKAPAILSAPYGKGSITVMGFSPGLHKYAAFAPVVERIVRGMNVSERFTVSDPNLVLREWQYGTDTYLLLTSQAGAPGRDWGLDEVEIGIRGRVCVEDYLFGRQVKSDYKDGYTLFKTLASNGGRIFRISSGKIAPASDPAAMKRAAKFKLRHLSGTTGSYKAIALPYKGKLFDVSPLQAGKYVFSLATLGTGSDSRVGESFLTVRGGSEVQRKRIIAGKNYFFKMKEKTFKVRCIENFYMFPFYSVLEISEEKASPSLSDVQVRQKNDRTGLSNEFLHLIFSGKGASMVSMKLDSEQTEQVVNACAHAVTGSIPGPFRDHTFRTKVSGDGKSAAVEFTLPVAVQGKMLQQTVRMNADTAGFSSDILCRNATSLTETFDLRYHPMLAIGNSADPADIFFIPTAGKVKKFAFRGLNSGLMIPPSSNWAGIVDTAEKLAYVTTFPVNQVKNVYVWESNDFYTFELFAPKKNVPPGESVALHMNFLFFRGLTGIDIVKDSTAAYLDISDVFDQAKAFTANLTVSTAQGAMESVHVKARLMKDAEEIKPLQCSGDNKISFDSPAMLVLSGDMKELADGKYRIETVVTTRKSTFSFSKEIDLRGGHMASLSKACADFERKLESASRSMTAEKRFTLLVLIGNLKQSIDANKIDEAEKIRAKLHKEIK